jgi:two-component system, LytTR family, sensor kinase
MLSKSKLITVLIHILVWAVFGLAIFFRYPVFIGNGISYQLWVTQTVTLSLLVIAFYVNSSILVPRFLLKNHTVYYFVIVIAIVGVIVFINAWLETAFPIMNSQERVPDILRLPRLRKPGLGTHIDTLTIIISALVLVIGTSITVIQKWQKDKQEREELEKDKVSSELSFLKAQINPHFFFNTLNNIYALTKVDADEAGKAIHQLSRMMRYLLYETQQGQTMLSQEIAFVKDYISLMQLRLTAVVKVEFDVPTHLPDMPMAPMMLLPFVENAFKHGVSATQQSHIYIMVTQKDSVLDITVKNSIMKDKSLSLDNNSGIGLVNTRRRLDLLYPGKHKLEISEMNAGNEYTVHLMLDLS